MDVYRIAKLKRQARGRSSLAHWPASRTQEKKSPEGRNQNPTSAPNRPGPEGPARPPGHLASPAALPTRCHRARASVRRRHMDATAGRLHPWASCCRLIPGWLLRDACCARAGAQCTARRRNRWEDSCIRHTWSMQECTDTPQHHKTDVTSVVGTYVRTEY